MKKKEILNLVKKVHDLKKDRSNTLPENSYFLDRDEIICYPRSNGDSRYPYYHDGLVLFAHSEGYINCIEGDFNIFKSAVYNEDTNIGFFVGEKGGNGFFPISVTGAARQLYENIIDRYTIFTPVCAYYIVESEQAVYALRTYVDDHKHIRFSVGVVNLAEEREIYISSYFEPTLRNDPRETFWNRMSKFGECLDYGRYVIKVLKHGTFCLGIKSKIDGEIKEKYSTAAKLPFIGRGGGNLTNALALKNGYIDRQVKKTTTVDFPVACDMVHFVLPKDGLVQMNYEMAVFYDEMEAEQFALSQVNIENEQEILDIKRREAIAIDKCTSIEFKEWYGERLHPNVLNHFLGCVKRQVSLCALGKNYATSFLGIRDVFQQLELSLIWQREESRKQMVRVMNYMLEDGRPPRQIAFPMREGELAKMDLRPFIDQGFWIVSTVHTYLAYTSDFSILQEICGYYKAETTKGPISKSEKKNSILEHLLTTMHFLISNIDEETNCIRALFGDWNDALDALGKTNDETKEFGNGVSVMATLQLYLSLNQMSDILGSIGGYERTVDEYRRLREKVAEGVLKYALLRDENGSVKMAHGWGEDKSFYVGSYKDHDGQSRISLTANAFCAISELIERIPECKEDIVKNILSLETRFGLLTFDKPFTPDYPQVGRISTITPGTYENACTYVHAGTFGTMALFMMGYSKDAWRILEKAMVVSHDKVTMTTFVMPNSYCIDGDYDFDGESMGDWHTGSGAVLMKNIIKCGFGIEPMMNDLKVIPANYIPADNAEITLPIGNNDITVKYENSNSGERKFYLDGKELETSFDSIRNTPFVIISKKILRDGCVILIKD